MRLENILVVHDAQQIAVDAVLLEQAQRRESPAVGAVPAPGEPVEVMQLARPVQTQADREALARQKLAPLFIEHQAIGLQVVDDFLSGAPVLALQ